MPRRKIRKPAWHGIRFSTLVKVLFESYRLKPEQIKAIVAKASATGRLTKDGVDTALCHYKFDRASRRMIIAVCEQKR